MSDRVRNAWQESIIESIVQQTPTVKSFVFRPRQWDAFLPGQHVDVRLTAPDGYEARRSYSLSSPPGLATFELAMERLSDGEVSPFFHDVALVGDTIEIAGPFTEHFVWRSANDGPTLLIGGGSGMAPFMSMLRYRATLPDAPGMTFVYSARTWGDVIFRDELLQMEKMQKGLRIVFVFTRAVTPSVDTTRMSRAADYVRRIDQIILSEIIGRMASAPMTTFVCGNNGFVGAVSDALVATGIDADGIKTERYGE